MSILKNRILAVEYRTTGDFCLCVVAISCSEIPYIGGKWKAYMCADIIIPGIKNEILSEDKLIRKTLDFGLKLSSIEALAYFPQLEDIV